METVRKSISDLVVDTVGHCFLCLNTLPSQSQVTLSGQRPCGKPTSVHSLHHLSSFLQLDKLKVFKESGSIPEQLLAKVLKSKLKSELCMECKKLSDKFSQLYTNMERIRIEMEDCLTQVHEKLRMEKELERADLIHKVANYGMSLNAEVLQEKLQIFDVLRTDAKQKCSLKMGSLHPKIKVQRLTQPQISKALKPYNFHGPSNENSDKSEISYVKLVCRSPEIASDSDGNSFQCVSENGTKIDSVGDDDDPSMHGEMSKGSKLRIANKKITSRKEGRVGSNSPVIPPPIKVTGKVGHPRGQCTLNSKSGKYKCQNCPSDFTAVRNFYIHFQSKHLKVRYKCPLPLCQKDYHNKRNYELHYLAAHTGIRIKCDKCCMTFSHWTSRHKHMRSLCPGRRDNKEHVAKSATSNRRDHKHWKANR